MSINVHYVSHLDNFSDNRGDYSDEQGERFHKDSKVLEDRYRDRWDKRTMSDYSWSVKRDEDNANPARGSLKLRLSLCLIDCLVFLRVFYLL